MNFSFWPFLWFGLPGRLLNDQKKQRCRAKIALHTPKSRCRTLFRPALSHFPLKAFIRSRQGAKGGCRGGSVEGIAALWGSENGSRYRAEGGVASTVTPVQLRSRNTRKRTQSKSLFISQTALQSCEVKFWHDFWEVNFWRVNFRGGLLLEKEQDPKIRPENSDPKFGRPKLVSQNSAPNLISGGAKIPCAEMCP